MRFSEELREAHADQWDRVINHKFTNELASGKIDRQVLRRYLIQDHRFLDAFIILLSSIVARARKLEDRIPGCQFLGIVSGKENTYFERCFEKLGLTNKEIQSIPNESCTTGFINLMKEAANGGQLGEMLSVIVVCEWSYLSWGQRVQKDTNRDDFMTYEWVDLHSGPYFESVVSYFRHLLDEEGRVMIAEEKSMCHKAFAKALQLEEDFFNKPYDL